MNDSTSTNDTVTELNATADKLTKAARGAFTRITETGQDWFQELVKAGESLRQRNAKKTGTAKGTDNDWRVRLAHGLGLPTREEMESLDKKLNRISRKVNKLAREQKA
ncbi:poly(hydroxyalkanoate) granule-associated protein [Alloalcanivorax marinus]|uniref:poly(hydroxyalkanoate) granule-associated protein n=1 Tax=Alloalcanivorax marinus TaxID=1177169 RepID=UPI001931552A|nr:poly(hydroxyalkanoate) granule-associated protein [Alloalcanivorax marinus]MBL7249729.1 poly(hydroxyalkanoate) granule-associated protein [Alloalcanivorax marinus]